MSDKVEKPDFENEEIGGWVDLYAMLHSLYDRNTQPQIVNDAIISKFNHVWSSHVEPLQNQLSEIVKANHGLEKARIEKESELLKLRKERDQFAIGFAAWADDEGWEFMNGRRMWYKWNVGHNWKTSDDLVSDYKKSLKRMSEQWEKGFDDGYQFALLKYDPHTGSMKKNYPNKFVHRGDAWSCGYGEGLISGRSKQIDDAFPGYRSISWPGGRAEVIY